MKYYIKNEVCVVSFLEQIFFSFRTTNNRFVSLLFYYAQLYKNDAYFAVKHLNVSYLREI